MAATDRDIELRITATDDASKTIGDVATKLDKLDDAVEIDIDADTGGALSDIERLDRTLDGITSARGREVLIQFRGQRLESEIRKAVRALDGLEDPIEIEARTGDLERAQADLLELQRLAADKYEIDIDVKAGSTAKLDDVKRKTDEIGESGRAGGTAIGGIGGSISELPGIGSLGPIAESLGQLTENALEGGESIRGITSALGILGGTAVVMFGIQKAMQSIAETDAFNEEQAENFRTAIDEVGEGLGAVLKTLKEAKGVTGRAGGLFGSKVLEGTKDITTELTRAGVSVDEFIAAVADGGPALDRVVGKLRRMQEAAVRAQGSARGDAYVQAKNDITAFGDAIEIVGETHENYASQVEDSTAWTEFLAGSQLDAAFAAGEMTKAQALAGDEAERMATRAESSATRVGAAADRLLGKLNLEAAVIAWNDDVNQMIAKSREGADISAAEWKQFQIDTIQTLKDLGADPATLVTVSAMFDEGLTEEELNGLLWILGDQASRNPVLLPVRLIPDPNQPKIRNPNGSNAPIIPDWPPGVGTLAPLAAAAPTTVHVHMNSASTMRDLDRTVQRWGRVNGGSAYAPASSVMSRKKR